MLMVQSRSLVESSHLGVIVLTGFAVIWVVAAASLSSLPMMVTLAAAVGVLVVGVAIILAASRRRFDPNDESRSPVAPRHRRSVFIAANIAQAVLFSVLISVCIAVNELAHIALIGSVIVGAHLIPIGLSFAEFSFVAGGALLALTGAAGTLAAWLSPITAEFATGVASLANAAVLLTVAGLQVRRYSQRDATTGF